MMDAGVPPADAPLPGDATQMLPAPAWSDPRVHLLDDTWLLTIFAILLATALPWLMSGFDIDFFAASIGLLALGAIHIGFTLVARPRAAAHGPLPALLHVAGVVVIGFIWLYAGGLQNPAFLLVFALPVTGAIFLSRWQPYVVALLAIIVAGAVALAQAPELRWYVPGLNAAGAWLAAAFNRDGAAIGGPFPGFYAPSSYSVVLLQVFAVLLVACAVAAEYLGTVFERLHAHVSAAQTEAERGQELWARLIEELPLPALLIDADTLLVVCASERLSEFCAAAPESGRGLFETLRFSYPDMVQDLITGAGGVVPLSMIRAADRLRATEVHVRHVTQEGHRFALLLIHDKTEEFTLKAALDLAEQAALVIDAQGTVLTFNKPAQTLFAGLVPGADAARVLAHAAMPGRWWEPGLTGRRKMHAEIATHVYQVTTAALPLPGEEERIYVVAFAPMARVAGDRGLAAPAQLSSGAPATLSNSKAAPR